MKIIVLIFCSIYLFAYNDIDNKTAFEMLMFKSGVTSLTKDFEIEKDNIQKNSNDIEVLQKEVEYLLKENMKLKLGSQDINLQEENKLLKQELEKLKVMIENQTLPKRKKVHSSNQKQIMVRIGHNNGTSYREAHPNSNHVYTYERNSVIKIEYCDKFGWCKIQNKDEYLPKYKLIFD